MGGGWEILRGGRGVPVNILTAVTNHKKRIARPSVSTVLLAPGRRDKVRPFTEKTANILLTPHFRRGPPGHQAKDLPTLRWCSALPPPPGACHSRAVAGNNAPPERPWLRRWQQPRHRDDSHFLGNRASHLYLCWEPPHLEPSCDLGSYF